LTFEIKVQTDNALHAYKPLLPAVKTGQPHISRITLILKKKRDIIEQMNNTSVTKIFFNNIFSLLWYKDSNFQ